MAADGHQVGRVDVGDGIFLWVPVDATAPVAPPSRRVPAWAVALGVALSGAALARHGMTREGVLAAGLLPVLAALAAIDLRARVLPNRIVGPALAAVLAWQLLLSTDRVPEYLLAAAGAGAFVLLPSLLRPGAMGMGDVKLAGLLGLALGADVVAALLVGFLTAAPVAAGILLLGGAEARKTAMPFGPFLAFGAAVVLLV